MKTLADIKHDLATGRYELTQQAFRQAIEQDIGDEDIRYAGESAVILEEFLTTEGGPNCLIAGGEAEQALQMLVSRANRDSFCCQVCGNTTALGEMVDEIFHIAGRYVMVEGIPASVCGVCGDKIYSPVTTAKLQILLRSTVTPLKNIHLIAYSY